MTELEPVRMILEMLSYLVIIGGVPVALYQYIRSNRAERRLREKAVYDALDQRYLDYLMLCLDHPDLDVFDIPLAEERGGREAGQQKRKEQIAYTYLLNIFERAYLMYRDQSTAFKQQQWAGWESYIRGYTGRKNFQDTMKKIGLDEFDRDFVTFLRQDKSERKLPNY
jgi:hypothetical protein